LLRRQQQVQMVAHQHVGVEVHALPLCMLLQQRENPLPVAPVDKDVLAVVAAQDHMVRISGDGEPGQSGH